MTRHLYALWLLALAAGCDFGIGVGGGLPSFDGGLEPGPDAVTDAVGPAVDGQTPDATGLPVDAGPRSDAQTSGDAAADDAGTRPDLDGSSVDAAPGSDGACVPAPESCNSADDDCDGEIDEDPVEAGGPCGSDVGACTPGLLRCVAGELICFGGVSPVPEACDGLDNDCDGRVDEDADCAALGEPCDGERRCLTGTCVNDLGQRYCSEACEPGAPGACGDLRCSERLGRPLCLQVYAPCTAGEDCREPGHACQLVTPHADGNALGGECRPLIPGGLALGETCGAVAEGRCATNLCLNGVQRCTALCRGPEGCPEGFACSLTPFTLAGGERLDLGLCLQACGGDADCGDDGRLCQYSLQADRAAIVGFCDQPFEGGAPGDVCNPGGNPPLGCMHGYCRRDGDARYCTQGCVEDAHCPAGWRCVEEAVNGGALSVGLCRRP